MNTLFLALILAQPNVPQAPSLDGPIPVPQVPVDKVVPLAPTYAEMRQRAVQEHKTLLVFVQCPVKAVPAYALGVRVEALVGYQGPCIVVGVPSGGDIYFSATYGPDDQLLPAAKAVSLPAIPFGQYQQETPTAQRDRQGAGSAGRHEGHNCPQCGARQTTISGAGPSPGTHRHTCPRCSTSWYH